MGAVPHPTRLDDLPRPSSQRLAVRTTPDARRRLRAGHPWLYEGSIRSVSRDGVAGDLAVVFDDDRRFVAVGLWDPASPIRLKVLHQGAPTTIDAPWFLTRLAAAIDRRAPLLAGTDAPTTGYRLVHGENDGLPGLVVDRYADVLVVKLYTAAWVPHLRDVVDALVDLCAPTSVVLRLSRSARDQELHGLEEGQVLAGEPVTGPVTFLEAGLTFEADVVRGQKTGHFLDQRDNRRMIGALAHGTRVLDVFCCTGGFSVHAAAGGANAVLSIDASPFAIAATQRHLALNRSLPAVAACSHEAITGDAFAELERLGTTRRRFDIVVVDPPSFAQNATQVPRAVAAYERLAALAVPLVAKGGLLLQASCSSRVTEADFVRAVHAGAAAAGFDLEEVERTGHALDHPIGFSEGAYLKAVLARPVVASPGSPASASTRSSGATRSDGAPRPASGSPPRGPRGSGPVPGASAAGPTDRPVRSRRGGPARPR